MESITLLQNIQDSGYCFIDHRNDLGRCVERGQTTVLPENYPVALFICSKQIVAKRGKGVGDHWVYCRDRFDAKNYPADILYIDSDMVQFIPDIFRQYLGKIWTLRRETARITSKFSTVEDKFYAFLTKQTYESHIDMLRQLHPEIARILGEK
ncbi:MAG: hypothetical protein UT24_C0011G0020 [Candidatus Woesebacteria bacterium GW2011_GWB1_39_12]|uniref:Uncharacterized protein n=1 Tax=Candidatus Woesebacteria bacterium GW2011_GWB1_39_12 TaxID=1618574 RepID=A0A0G0QFQ5_9BACT|nr:MAG: hypothetical protein UT24_C0011G0020 [Candidatus Woesebacteria bacterium GW2011_GWB1_39_12]